MPSLSKIILFTLLTTALAAPTPKLASRQLAGEGAAANSILSDTDNAIGYGTEDAEDNLANNIATITGHSAGNTGGGGSGSSGNPPPPPPGGPHRPQRDKVAAGMQAI